MPRTPRQMHGRRAFAAVAAAGLLASLFAPWYRWTVVAPGVHGLRTLTLTRSGWQAFSTTELLLVVVAVLTLLVTIGMPSDVPEDRRRLWGVVVAVLSAVAFVVVLARLTTAPGTTKHALSETMVAIRWGIFLALACCAALTGAGLRLIRARQPAARTSRAELAPRPERARRQQRVPRPDRARPSADRTDDRAPSAVASTRRPDRPTPLWDEQAAGWLDLPD